MNILSLNGSEWKVSKKGNNGLIPASVPGTIHEDLLNAEKIEDPFYRDNELNLMWIGETDWVYSRSFNVNNDILQKENILLKCHGLDTIATIYINGKKVGYTDNMFRQWNFDIKKYLKTGKNIIKIVFGSAIKYMDKRGKSKLTFLGHPGKCFIRKMQCNSGWDWGPQLVTCGIWQDIEIISWDTAKIKDALVQQKHSKNKADLSVTLETEGKKNGLKAEISIFYNDKKIKTEIISVKKIKETVEFHITNPKLWWPAGMGSQPLYNIRINLFGGSPSGRSSSGGSSSPATFDTATLLDKKEFKIGLRTLELRREKDKWGESFEFVANGIPFYAKGANWIPEDAVYSRTTEDDYRRLLTDAKTANMNMIRVWGGGIYERDAFYDICDELGICIWQDFMFACSSYPYHEEEFAKNVDAELEDNIRKLRNRACLALWCGNNEIIMCGYIGNGGWPKMTIKQFEALFVKKMQQLVNKFDPDRKNSYWPTSPMSSLQETYPKNYAHYTSDPTSGDEHMWDVWHGRKPFEFYRTSFHRFCSEFGFQSFTEPKTTDTFTLPQDKNVTSKIMEHHQRCGTANSLIIDYMLSWYRMPVGFDNTLWLSQIQQGLSIKYAVEHWRRNMGRCRGAIYWQLNDCWPVASWASIDYEGRWKALHYMAKNFYAPVLLSILEDSEKKTMEIHVSSDALKNQKGKVEWQAYNSKGDLLDSGKSDTEIKTNKSKCVKKLNFKIPPLKGDQGGCYNAEEILFFAILKINGKVVSDNFASFAKPKHIELAKPEISTRISKLSNSNTFSIKLKSDKPALCVWLELKDTDAKLSDNFFNLSPEIEKEITINPAEKMTVKELKNILIVKSIWNTYQEN